MFRVRDGKITEGWHYGDDMAVFAELGVDMASLTQA